MKILQEEHGIRFIPENSWEQECLQKIANKTITAKWSNSWDQTGELIIEYEVHPWDKYENR